MRDEKTKYLEKIQEAVDAAEDARASVSNLVCELENQFDILKEILEGPNGDGLIEEIYELLDRISPNGGDLDSTSVASVAWDLKHRLKECGMI